MQRRVVQSFVSILVKAGKDVDDLDYGNSIIPNWNVNNISQVDW